MNHLYTLLIFYYIKSNERVLMKKADILKKVMEKVIAF